MEGDGLLVDTDAIAAWMAELPPPIGRPARDDADRALIERGRLAYDAAACGDCHSGPDLADGRSHDVLTPSPDAAARLDLAQTPTLRGVRARPPYFHDGRSPTLRDALVEHGATADLDALVAYLETL